tara:strand:- start:63 stop:275 length:213 start_codon:yes stop_codon:yes gene_type:complete
MELNKDHRQFIVDELKKIAEEIETTIAMRKRYLKKDDQRMADYVDMQLLLLINNKAMLEQAIVNNYIEEL